MYESKAECKFLRSLGGDCVGMSTIPEVVAAHHCGIKVLCMSLITNKVVTKDDPDLTPANHAEVLAAVEARTKDLQSLVRETVASLKIDVLPKLEPLPDITLNLKTEWTKTGAAMMVGAAAVLVGVSLVAAKR